MSRCVRIFQTKEIVIWHKTFPNVERMFHEVRHSLLTLVQSLYAHHSHRRYLRLPCPVSSVCSPLTLVQYSCAYHQYRSHRPHIQNCHRLLFSWLIDTPTFVNIATWIIVIRFFPIIGFVDTFTFNISLVASGFQLCSFCSWFVGALYIE